jgi:hypothetical protein
MVTSAPPGVTFTSSTTCPHTVFMWFFNGSQKKTEIIFLYSINWLVCITDMVCVYCAVRTEPVTNVEVVFVFKCWNMKCVWAYGLRLIKLFEQTIVRREFQVQCARELRFSPLYYISGFFHPNKVLSSTYFLCSTCNASQVGRNVTEFRCKLMNYN